MHEIKSKPSVFPAEWNYENWSVTATLALHQAPDSRDLCRSRAWQPAAVQMQVSQDSVCLSSIIPDGRASTRVSVRLSSALACSVPKTKTSLRCRQMYLSLSGLCRNEVPRK